MKLTWGVAEFRAAAVRRNIDPIEGANSFQSCLMAAAQAEDAKRCADDANWWRRRDIFGKDEGRTEGEPGMIDLRQVWKRERKVAQSFEMALLEAHIKREDRQQRAAEHWTSPVDQLPLMALQ
jgi:hypothetical protein